MCIYRIINKIYKKKICVFNILLIIWEFHVMHPGHAHFPVLRGPLLLGDPPQKKNKKIKQTQFVWLIYAVESNP